MQLMQLTLAQTTRTPAAWLCGMETDCPRNYSPHDINISASQWNPFAVEPRRKLNQRRKEAMSQCTQQRELTTTGGWCLEKGRTVYLPHNESYMLPRNHVPADEGLSDVLLSILSPKVSCLRRKSFTRKLKKKSKDTSVSKEADEDDCASFGLARKTSVNDFGAGVGQYGHRLRSEDPDLLWTAYDGAGNVEEYTDGFVTWFDLTVPFSLPRADWVVSFEVGEHVPTAFEGTVIRNLHAHNCRGVILSWAVLNQEGRSHVNNHGNQYVIDTFHELGYLHREQIDRKFRSKAIYGWFKHSVMVFERYNPVNC